MNKIVALLVAMLFATAAHSTAIRFQAQGFITQQGSGGASSVLNVGDPWSIDFVLEQSGGVGGVPPSFSRYQFVGEGSLILGEQSLPIQNLNPSSNSLLIRQDALVTKPTFRITTQFAEQIFLGSAQVQNFDFMLYGSTDEITNDDFAQLANYSLPVGVDTTNWFSVGTSQDGQVIAGNIMSLRATDVLAPIATPATLPLLGLGLAALSFSRRKRKQHLYYTHHQAQQLFREPLSFAHKADAFHFAKDRL